MTNPTTITAQPGTPFIDVVREFDATPAQVFRVQTDPELLGKWLGPRDLELRLDEYDARPGGTYRYVHRDAQGGEYGFRGVFHTVVKNELVIQTFEFEGVPNQVAIETMTLTDLGNGRTRLHTHSVYPSVEGRDAAVASGMEHGIRDSMDRLEKLCADV
jgi:uncharacterized protein YndB with AHSA1/START domain